eukprot:scaffold4957_cov152-Amphora_coffeaeformis.AAC.6
MSMIANVKHYIGPIGSTDERRANLASVDADITDRQRIDNSHDGGSVCHPDPSLSPLPPPPSPPEEGAVESPPLWSLLSPSFSSVEAWRRTKRKRKPKQKKLESSRAAALMDKSSDSKSNYEVIPG